MIELQPGDLCIAKDGPDDKPNFYTEVEFLEMSSMLNFARCRNVQTGSTLVIHTSKLKKIEISNDVAGSDYAAFVMSLAKPGDSIIKELTPQKAHLWHMASALMGESAELFDAIKKHVIYNKPLDMENLTEEVGDIAFYLTGLLCSLGIKQQDCINQNFAKLRKRYRNGYSNQAAQERADKQ